MRLSFLFALYSARLFLFWLAASLFAMAVIVALFDSVELFRRAAQNDAATFRVVISMSLLKLPHLIERGFPIATLLAAMLTLWRLNRHQELVVVRSIGVSVWQMILPLAVGAGLVGVIELMIFNPVSAALYARYQSMEAQYFDRKSALAAVTGDSVWFRQPTAAGHYFMYASGIEPASGRLSDVMVLLMRGEDTFVGRIDADRARLGSGYWALYDATLSAQSEPPRRIAAYRLETNLTIEKIQDSFADPATLSFWELPGFVRVLETAGFSAIRHKLHWQGQLALPLLLVSIVLLAATFSLRPLRRGGARSLVLAGLASGFMLFILIDVVTALGASARIPIWLAAWSPMIVTTLLGSAMLFHLEDG